MHELSDGFIQFDKDRGLTSFQALSRIKKILGIKKIGHAGTLDKNASGLLIIGIGKSTRLLKFILNQSKTYVAEILFGIQTNTDDAEGSVIKRYEGEIDLDVILDANKGFIGRMKQVPPDFSAVHVNGERAYKLALKNSPARIGEREIEIYSNKFISFENNRLVLEISCTSGTYIRSIARDIGKITGYYAHLSNLRRTKIGEFDVKDAVDLQKLSGSNYNIIEPYDALYNLKPIEVREEFVGHIKNGKKITGDFFYENMDFQDGYYKLHSNKNIVGIVNYKIDSFHYDLVY